MRRFIVYVDRGLSGEPAKEKTVEFNHIVDNMTIDDICRQAAQSMMNEFVDHGWYEVDMQGKAIET